MRIGARVCGDAPPCVPASERGVRALDPVPGRSVTETRTRSVFWVYMTYRDLVMAALSCWSLICDF